MNFTLNKAEQKTAEKMARKHGRLHHWVKPSPSYFTYTFVPTGIGTKITCRCTCGEENDISDYESW